MWRTIHTTTNKQENFDERALLSSSQAQLFLRLSSSFQTVEECEKLRMSGGSTIMSAFKHTLFRRWFNGNNTTKPRGGASSSQCLGTTSNDFRWMGCLAQIFGFLPQKAGGYHCCHGPNRGLPQLQSGMVEHKTPLLFFFLWNSCRLYQWHGLKMHFTLTILAG